MEMKKLQNRSTSEAVDRSSVEMLCSSRSTDQNAIELIATLWNLVSISIHIVENQEGERAGDAFCGSSPFFII